MLNTEKCNTLLDISLAASPEIHIKAAFLKSKAFKPLFPANDEIACGSFGLPGDCEPSGRYYVGPR